jgi:putative NIF3 family GTP cyclohydrolase 1 type 2
MRVAAPGLAGDDADHGRRRHARGLGQVDGCRGGCRRRRALAAVRSDTAAATTAAEGLAAPGRSSHCGFSVATTKSRAMPTVTAWEKISQSAHGMHSQSGKGGHMAQRTEIESHLSALLAVDRFKDYGPNGLQVEGRPEVRRLVSGVTASLALIEAASWPMVPTPPGAPRPVLARPDGLLTGWLRQRLAPLLAPRHQPVRLPPAAGRARRTGQQRAAGPAPGPAADARFGDQDLGFIGPAAAADAAALAAQVQAVLGRTPVLLPGDGRPLRRVAWCTGGAQGLLRGRHRRRRRRLHHRRDLRAAGALARETGVAFLACGHHATERYGAPAVGDHLAQQLRPGAPLHRHPNPA